MMNMVSWRIEHTAATPSDGDVQRWSDGLLLHLRHQQLSTLLVRRDGAERAYVLLEGCPACRTERCDRGCHRALFEQLVRTSLRSATLRPAQRVVERPAEVRCVLARPGAKAQPLDSTFLGQWDEGRLLVTWSRQQTRPYTLSTGAMLITGASGPNPQQVLRAAGWTVDRLPTLLRARRLRSSFAHVATRAAAGQLLLDQLIDPATPVGLSLATNTPTTDEPTATAPADRRTA